MDYLGHFLLTELFKPLLVGARGRVVNVASAASFLACRWAAAPDSCTELSSLPPPAHVFRARSRSTSVHPSYTVLGFV